MCTTCPIVVAHACVCVCVCVDNKTLHAANTAELRAGLARQKARAASTGFAAAPPLRSTPVPLASVPRVGTRGVRQSNVLQVVPSIRMKPQSKLPAYCLWIPLHRNLLTEDENVLRCVLVCLYVCVLVCVLVCLLAVGYLVWLNQPFPCIAGPFRLLRTKTRSATTF